jgi:nucleoside 2-deoxyribosyltransferase
MKDSRTVTKSTVYLAGPITGLSYEGATDWRQYAIDVLASHGIVGVSPMRGKEYLSRFSNLSGTGQEYSHLGVFATPEAVLTRDHWDATRCDVMLVNVLGAKAISVGTVMEVAWAFTHKIPIVCAIAPDDTVHTHMMFTGAVKPFRVPTLDDALKITEAILR